MKNAFLISLDGGHHTGDDVRNMDEGFYGNAAAMQHQASTGLTVNCRPRNDLKQLLACAIDIRTSYGEGRKPELAHD